MKENGPGGFNVVGGCGVGCGVGDGVGDDEGKPTTATADEKDDVCFSPEALASIFRVHLVVLLLNAWISKLFANAVRRSHRLENAAGVDAVPGQMFEQTRNVLS